MHRLALSLDEIRTYTPDGFKVSIVLCSDVDASATIILGQVPEPDLVEHIQATIDDPGPRGVVNSETGYAPQAKGTH